jgi:hypothetical protein
VVIALRVRDGCMVLDIVGLGGWISFDRLKSPGWSRGTRCSGSKVVSVSSLAGTDSLYEVLERSGRTGVYPRKRQDHQPMA